jgi:hypothetical protein
VGLESRVAGQGRARETKAGQNPIDTTSFQFRHFAVLLFLDRFKTRLFWLHLAQLVPLDEEDRPRQRGHRDYMFSRINEKASAFSTAE